MRCRLRTLLAGILVMALMLGFARQWYFRYHIRPIGVSFSFGGSGGTYSVEQESPNNYLVAIESPDFSLITLQLITNFGNLAGQTGGSGRWESQAVDPSVASPSRFQLQENQGIFVFRMQEYENDEKPSSELFPQLKVDVSQEEIDEQTTGVEVATKLVGEGGAILDQRVIHLRVSCTTGN